MADCNYINWNKGQSGKFYYNSDIFLCHMFPILTLSYYSLSELLPSRDRQNRGQIGNATQALQGDGNQEKHYILFNFCFNAIGPDDQGILSVALWQHSNMLFCHQINNFLVFATLPALPTAWQQLWTVDHALIFLYFTFAMLSLHH